MKRIVVTGANRGLGLEFVRQYLADGAHVVGACRNPDKADALKKLPRETGKLDVLALDVGDESSIEAFGEAVGQVFEGIDLLINNAGVFPDERSFDAVATEHFIHAFQVNTVGPFFVTRTLLPLLEKGVRPLVVNISSGMGSIRSKLGGEGPNDFAYSTSKAALNMLTALMAGELKPKGIAVIAQGPGWVQTDMGGEDAALSPQQSITSMRRAFEKTGIEQTGQFQDRDGVEMEY